LPDLFPYQLKGAEFLASARNAILADEMGLGKSAQAITAAERIGAERILVICPAIARINWQREFERWHSAALRIVQVDDGTATGNVEICSYESAIRPARYRYLQAVTWDLVILDEAHLLRNHLTKRSRAVLGGDGIARRAKRVFALTGTPTPNHPGELWSLLRALAPDVIVRHGKTMSYDEFLHRYCVVKEGAWGPIIVAARNIEDLRARVAPVMLRRLKKDVLNDLPPIRYEITTLTAAKAGKFNQKILERAAQALAGGKTVVGDDALSTARREAGLEKADILAELLVDELEQNPRKIVVFAWHTDVSLALFNAFEAAGLEPAMVIGSTPARERQENVDRFQNDPSCRVFVGNIIAAGTAITLTAASELVFAELSFVPADNSQAAQRVHRIGQTEPVRVRTMALAGTADEILTRILERKIRIINATLGKGEVA
jgi:SWI/SNF-related matrix-associated actin-dependent regulator 1 of chromatin subfamily A